MSNLKIVLFELDTERGKAPGYKPIVDHIRKLYPGASQMYPNVWLILSAEDSKSDIYAKLVPLFQATGCLLVCSVESFACLSRPSDGPFERFNRPDRT